MTRELKACPPRRAIIEAALISAAKCLEAEGKRQTWSDLAAAVDAELSSLPNPEGLTEELREKVEELLVAIHFADLRRPRPKRQAETVQSVCRNGSNLMTLQPRHCQVPDCAACEALDRYGVQEPRDPNAFPNPVAPDEDAELVERLWRATKHGDEDHQTWLREAYTAFFSGQPVPAPRGADGLRKALEAIRGAIGWNTDGSRALIEQIKSTIDAALGARE